MEYLNYLLIGLLVFLLLQRMLPAKGIRQITTAELKGELKDKKKQFIDVRTNREFQTNHIKEFKNIPLHELHDKSNMLDKDKEVVVICQSGMRSNKAGKLLKKAGFKHITNVKGGMSAWS